MNIFNLSYPSSGRGRAGDAKVGMTPTLLLSSHKVMTGQ